MAYPSGGRVGLGDHPSTGGPEGGIAYGGCGGDPYPAEAGLAGGGEGGDEIGARRAGRNRATRSFRWRHASIVYHARNPAPAMARPTKRRIRRLSSPTPPTPS